MKDYIFTSESITEGHPDKICDSIADAILDEALRQDPYSNMAVEATIKDDFVLIYGEADTKAHIDYETIAKNVIRKIGYEEEYTVMVKVNKQSSDCLLYTSFAPRRMCRMYAIIPASGGITATEKRRDLVLSSLHVSLAGSRSSVCCRRSAMRRD